MAFQWLIIFWRKTLTNAPGIEGTPLPSELGKILETALFKIYLQICLRNPLGILDYTVFENNLYANFND